LSVLTKFGAESRINCLSAGEILLLINKWVQERLGHSLTIKKLCKIGVSVLETRHFMPVAKPMVKTVMCGYLSGSITLNDLSSIVRCNCVDTASIEIIDDYWRSEVRKRVRYFDDLDSLDKVFLSALLKILQTSDALLE